MHKKKCVVPDYAPGYAEMASAIGLSDEDIKKVKRPAWLKK